MITRDIPIRVRYYETDCMGFVHHSNYVRYYETARTVNRSSSKAGDT